jgi:hypothetical protein
VIGWVLRESGADLFVPGLEIAGSQLRPKRQLFACGTVAFVVGTLLTNLRHLKDCGKGDRREK